MIVTKCDICKKEIRGEAVIADFNKHFSTQTFCLKCGKPVADFLNKLKKNKYEKRKK